MRHFLNLRMTGFHSALGAAMVFSLALEPVARADSIELLNGQRHDNVQILSAKWDLVRYRLANAPQAQSVPGERVLAIVRESTLLQGPRMALESGRAAKALNDLESIVAAPGKEDDWQKGEAMFLLARAQRVAGQSKVAITAYKDYLEKFKAAKDWFLPRATYELGETQLGASLPGTAEITFKELAAYGGQWTLRSKLGEAMAALAAKGAAEAMKIRGLCDEVVKSRDAPPELRNEALVIRARVLLLQKNPKQAIEELTNNFFSVTKSDLTYSAERAKATLLMGKAFLLQEGKESQDWAEIWFLRVASLYRSHSALYAEACDQLSALYQKAGNSKRADEWKARKDQARTVAPAHAPAPSSATPTTPAAPQPTSKKASPPATAQGGGSKGSQ